MYGKLGHGNESGHSTVRFFLVYWVIDLTYLYCRFSAQTRRRLGKIGASAFYFNPEPTGLLNSSSQIFVIFFSDRVGHCRYCMRITSHCGCHQQGMSVHLGWQGERSCGSWWHGWASVHTQNVGKTQWKKGCSAQCMRIPYGESLHMTLSILMTYLDFDLQGCLTDNQEVYTWGEVRWGHAYNWAFEILYSPSQR